MSTRLHSLLSHAAPATVVLATLSVLLLAAPPPAQAAVRIPVVINTGDILYPVAPLPVDYGLQPVMLGYKCSHLGVLWANVWTSDCRLVALPEEDSYADLPTELADRLSQDPRLSFEHAQRGLWHRYGFWGPVGAVGSLLAAVLGLLVLSALFSALGWVSKAQQGQVDREQPGSSNAHAPLSAPEATTGASPGQAEARPPADA